VPKPSSKSSTKLVTPAGHAAASVSAKVAADKPKSSGVRLVQIRVSAFRSLTNIELNLDELTVLVGANNAGKTSLLDAIQFSIGASRRILGKEDIRLGKDETDVPKDRRAIVDILLRPTDDEGKVVETFPEGSFWTGLWGTGIAQDDDQNDMVGIRSALEWSDNHGDYRTTRNFLREWKSFGDWQESEAGDSVGVGHIEPIALHYIDAKRDLEDDLRTRGSFWRKLTDDLGLSESDTEELEAALSDINKALVDKSEVLKHLREHLLELKNVIAFEKAGIDISPVPRHLRDLSRGVDVSLNSGGASAFPLTRHGMGTRSLASLLVFRAFALWRRERAEEGGDEVHTLLALEEPEAHLHPQAQRALFAQIRDIPGQRIVSTHSPYFVAQSRLEDLRLLSKSKSDTKVTQLDVSKLSADDRRKVEREVLASRGDLLFSRALILFEGETEEQALAIYAESYWGATAHEKGFSFVGCGGSNYQPFVWLAESLGIRWYILCDGEDKTVKSVDGQLKKLGLNEVTKLDNCSVIHGKTDYEGHLLNEGYLGAIEKGLDAMSGAGSLDKYINDLHGTVGKKVDGVQVQRDYKSPGGRERAARDLMQDRKTRCSGPIATAIVELADHSKRIPPAIRKLFSKVSADLKED
jgi:putative ATP-dependent endonuclease of the OLD family